MVSPNRQQVMDRWTALKSERSSWMAHWKEVSEVLLPRSGRFMVGENNNGARKPNKIYDSTATRALRILGAGLMSGATSPARPWFRLSVPDEELMRSAAVKLWLSEVTTLILNVFQRSNTYRALHSTYEEIGAFGTGASMVSDDFNTVLRHTPLTAGEYCIALDEHGNVCTLYREFRKSVGAVVKEFGRENCSATLRGMFDRGQLDAWVTLIHAIEPRADRDPSKRDGKNMAWKSVYFEIAGDADQVLRESGFKSFQVLVPRWQVTTGDIYGNGPGMESLGDIKQLQHEQLRKAQGIDYMVNPPKQMPISSKGFENNFLPGGVSYYDSASASGGIKTAFDVNLNLSYLLDDIRDVRERIRETFYSDLFRMLSGQDNSRMTATEVAERHEEKLLMLGPVIERLDNELLDPLVDGAFERLLAAGALPPPPPEMEGAQLNVVYTSVLAQAQRAVSTNGVDRFVGNLGQIAAFKPDVLDKFNSDAWADAYSDALGIDPTLIVASDKVALIRKDRAQAQAAQMQAAQMQQASETARNLGATPTDGGNAASNVMNLFSQGMG